MLGKFCRIVCLSFFSAAAAAVTIPSGANISVRLTSEVTSATAVEGQRFHATLAEDLMAHGKTIAKKGAAAKGKVTAAKSSGRLHAPGELGLRLTSVVVNGHIVPVTTGELQFKGKSHNRGNGEKIGGAAAAGALIGALAGGGKGAAIGTLAGAGAGTGVAAATGKEEAVLPAEAALTFITTAAAVVK